MRNCNQPGGILCAFQKLTILQKCTKLKVKLEKKELAGWGAGDKHLLSEIKIKKMNDLLKLFKLISGSKFVDQEYSNGSCSRLAHLERKIDHVHPCASLAICEIPR